MTSPVRATPSRYAAQRVAQVRVRAVGPGRFYLAGEVVELGAIVTVDEFTARDLVARQKAVLT
jgi:hypothetical protein